MSYLDFSHFSNRFRHIICQILFYGFVDMNYLILNEKGKKNEFRIIINDLFIFTKIIIGIHKIKMCDVMVQRLIILPVKHMSFLGSS